MNDDENLRKLKAENFDLGMTELFNACGMGVFHKIGLKKYITSYAGSLSSSSASSLGIKMHPSYIPGKAFFEGLTCLFALLKSLPHLEQSKCTDCFLLAKPENQASIGVVFLAFLLKFYNVSNNMQSKQLH